MTRGARRARRALLALVALAAAAHLAYWYLPRERPAAPDAEARARLLEAGWEVAAWIPYPHQNLARLEERVGDLRAWLELVAGGEDRSGRALPGFGPFVVPPARALAVAADGRGRLRAELAAYPAIALLARAAGAVARNPWLAGGEVRWGSSGRGTVAWNGTRWRFEGAAPADGDGAGRPPRGAEGARAGAGRAEEIGVETFGEHPALAWVRLGGSFAPLPAALYRVERDSRSGLLEVLAGSPPATPEAVRRIFESPSAPAGWYAEALPGGGARALALWDAASDVPGLPAMATLDRGPVPGFRLPTEGLARLFGRRLAEVESHGLRVRALEPETAARGADFAAALAAALGSRPGSGGLVAIAAARPEVLAARAGAAADALEAIPVLGAPEARPLRRLEGLLRPLAGCPGATLEVASGGAAVRLIPCAATVLSRGRSN